MICRYIVMATNVGEKTQKSTTTIYMAHSLICSVCTKCANLYGYERAFFILHAFLSLSHGT